MFEDPSLLFQAFYTMLRDKQYKDVDIQPLSFIYPEMRSHSDLFTLQIYPLSSTQIQVHEDAIVEGELYSFINKGDNMFHLQYRRKNVDLRSLMYLQTKYLVYPVLWFLLYLKTKYLVNPVLWFLYLQPKYLIYPILWFLLRGYRQLVRKLKGGKSVDLIFVGLTSYLQITPTTGFTLHGKKKITWLILQLESYCWRSCRSSSSRLPWSSWCRTIRHRSLISIK